MEAKIKALAEAIAHRETKMLIESHVKDLAFNEDTRHLIIHVDNAAPLHKLSEKENDKHLKKALEEVYGDDITYEVKEFKARKAFDRGMRFFGKIN